MNKVILMGRVVRNPEVRYTQGEKPMAIARYTLAVDRYVKKGEEKKADFISCIAMGYSGEWAEKYLNQGMKILVEGRWTTGSYVNKDGQKVYTNECVVDRHEFAEGKKSDQEQQNSNPASVPSEKDDSWMNIPAGIEDDSLPFN